jgi:adenosylcobinamide-GDP ribazoletransferase
LAGLASFIVACIIFMLIGLANYGLGCYFYRHISGYTGDCLAASQQFTEVIFYFKRG